MTVTDLWPEEVDALILRDENEFQIININEATYKKHRTIIVYNEQGKKYTNVVINENEFIKLKNVSGKILSLNGKTIKKLKQDDIYNENLSSKNILYDGNKYQWFALEGNTFPYILEYSYEQEYKSLFLWPPWYPQEDIPVLNSTYTLNLKKPIDYQTHAIGMQLEPQTIKENGESISTWKIENVRPPPLRSTMPVWTRTSGGWLTVRMVSVGVSVAVVLDALHKTLFAHLS